MEILIFSDAHGRREGMQEAIARQVGRVDAIFFLGDGLRDAYALDHPSLYAVRGNCDWFSEENAPTEIIMSLEGHTILATHGHAYGVKSGRGALIAHAAEVGADIVLFGHTHQPLSEEIPAGSVIGQRTLTRPMYLFNPGSIGTGGRSFGTLLLCRDTVLLAHGEL